ncbi:MAG: helix-turn-helix transcriptional regulator [Bdellovibrionales bacterium]|jgi:transcriptional regulator with XRE-family HTH domain
MDNDDINARQIKAARALLNWSQESLALASGLSVTTIRKIESGHLSPRRKTTKAILTGLKNSDIEFIDSTGVRLKKHGVEVIEGEDCYLRFLDKVYHDVKKCGGEILFMNADNSRMNRAEIDGHIRLRKCGLKHRSLMKEGNTHIVFPLSECRWIPEKYFKFGLPIIYQNKVAIYVYEKALNKDMDKIYVFNNAFLADAMKSTFEFMWDNFREPPLTTAPEVCS